MMGSTILAPQCLGTPFWELWCCGGAGCAVVAGQGAIAVLLSNGRDENTPLSPETGHGRMLGISSSARVWELAEVAANPQLPRV